MTKSILVYVITLLLIGCHVLVAQGRPDAGSNYQGGHAQATTMGSSVDESKLHLKMCLPRRCKDKGEPLNDDCICCLNGPGTPCFPTKDECLAHCPPL
ncbi:unnamed protein product [Alopecurus aequalis]